MSCYLTWCLWLLCATTWPVALVRLGHSGLVPRSLLSNHGVVATRRPCMEDLRFRRKMQVFFCERHKITGKWNPVNGHGTARYNQSRNDSCMIEASIVTEHAVPGTRKFTCIQVQSMRT